MKLLTLALVLLVGCNQPSAADKFNAETQALVTLRESREQLRAVKFRIDRGEGDAELQKYWDDNKQRFDWLTKAVERQEDRVRKAESAL
jgi:hypothetical protein